MPARNHLKHRICHSLHNILTAINGRLTAYHTRPLFEGELGQIETLRGGPMQHAVALKGKSVEKS